MKKSTLITTIAMIVVVVVALSTATYAWFSSSATAVASTTFTTNASGDWSMMIGSIDADGNLTFSGSAVDSTTLAVSPIASGLWAPTANINTAIASNAASTTVTGRAGFVQATKTGNNSVISKLQTANYNSAGAEGQGAAEPGLVAPYAIRIMNVAGAERTLQLNITLNAKQNGTNNSMYAAAAIRFYVYEISNAESNATASYTSGYNPIASGETATVNALTSITGNVTQGSAVNMTTGLAGSYLGKDGEENDAILSRPVSIINYNVANIASEFTTPGANENLGIAAGDHVKTYTFDMQTYGAGGYSNIIIYAWIDGWVANGSAQSANFDVNFGFTSVPRLSAGN